MRVYYTYIMSSKKGMLYIGVTNNIFSRVLDHKKKRVKGFTSKYNCDQLVYYEEYSYIDQAIRREKQLKKWKRSKKICLIDRLNPDWRDLAYDWYDEVGEGRGDCD